MKMKQSDFLDLIREEMEGFMSLNEQEEAKAKTPPLEDWLPTIKITENWGKERSRSREQLKLFINQVDKATRGADTFEGRVESLASFIRDEACPKSIAKTFARLMMLDLLVTVAGEFTESAGGFIFEALSAALAGYKGKQVTDRLPDGTLPIVDFTDGEIPYSLKLLTGDPEDRGRSGQSGETKGSVNNLLSHLVLDKSGYVRYIVAYRDADNLTFVGFDITGDNAGKVMALKGDKFTKGVFGLPASKVQNMKANKLYDIFKKKQEEKSLGKTQFALTRKDIETIANSRTIASIPVGRETLAKAAERCAEELKDKLIPIYKSIKSLTDNTNVYFLARDGDKRTASADLIMSIVSSGGELPKAIQASGIGEFEEE